MTDFSPQAAAEAIDEKRAATKRVFLAALRKAKSEFPTIVKEVSGGRYQYADLHTIASQVDPVLDRHGLTYYWETGNTPEGWVTVTCVLAHDDGYETHTSMVAPPDDSGGKQPIQAVGSTVTYLQRYTLNSALGLAVARDQDGAAKHSKKVTPSQAKELETLCKGRNQAALLERLGITSWQELPQADFQKTMTFIKAKTKGNDDE